MFLLSRILAIVSLQILVIRGYALIVNRTTPCIERSGGDNVLSQRGTEGD